MCSRRSLSPATQTLEQEVYPMHRRFSFLFAACAASAVSLLLAPAIARADLGNDLTGQSAPQRWVPAAAGKPMHYPAYFNDLDKAQANLSAGRYEAAYAMAIDAKLTKPGDEA